MDDISVFHRVDEPMDLPSSRFFQHAQRLRLRGGAVTAALADSRTDREEWTAPSGARDEQTASRNPGVAEGTSDDIAAMAAMSQHPGFPGIGYSGG